MELLNSCTRVVISFICEAPYVLQISLPPGFSMRLISHSAFDRSSQFFQENIRDAEYYAILEIAFNALNYNDTVLINAPFKTEIRDHEWLDMMRKKLAAKNAELCIIWVHTDVEVVHARMVARNSERDTWKIEHWDEYVATQDYSTPQGIPEMFIFNNSSDHEYDESIGKAVDFIRA